MAGPGGGPPRRSHTKSRKGCENCKRRHIRCDENFPQCRNCTKHKVRCPYNDVTVPDERDTTPDNPNLMWTSEIEGIITEWRNTGIFPLPNVVFPGPAPQCYSVEELRLIYHVATIYHNMEAIGANSFTLWTRQIPKIIAIGATQRYVMHALLAFSAEHIAFQTGCPLVGNMAYEHRGIALKGLQEAIGNFSQENSDAVLAASLVLSWQATDWRGWTHLMQGTTSIMEAIEQGKYETQFKEFIAESSTFPTAPPSPQPDRKPNQPDDADLEAFKRTIHHLAKVESHVKQNKGDTHLVQQLASFVKGARKVSPIQSIEDQFDRLRPLRTWLFWVPVDCLQLNGASPSALLVIAHYYTAAMMMERLFPEIGAAYFGSLASRPVEQIAFHLRSVHASGSFDGDTQTPLSLMQFPVDTMHEFRSRFGFDQSAGIQSFPQFDPPNFYMCGHGTPPNTFYLPYEGSPQFSLSQEDLPVFTSEPDCNSGMTPLTLSSPYHNGQYLSIPSPSYGGYSPASSTFGEGSTVYSDNEDFNSFDTSMSEFPHLVEAGHGNFCVGSTRAHHAHSSSQPSLEIPCYRQDPWSNPTYETTPSPFLEAHQWPTTGYSESTTPLSVSAPSPVFMPSPQFMHHRHTSSVSSAPVHYKREEEC